MKSYVLWNNKGGVGKSFLTFLCATEYAKLHPDEQVVVIDMCPQANVSEILLGGAEQYQNFLHADGLKKTVADYMIARLSSPYEKIGNESTYKIQVKQYNDSLTDNIWLVQGVNVLEGLVQDIDRLSVESPALPDAHKRIYNWINDLKSGLVAELGKKTTFFIDTNPSFSSYTKMAILSAEKLIVPCFSDVGSLLALDNLVRFLYSVDIHNGRNIKDGFRIKADRYSMSVPLIFMVVMGKSTTYDKDAATAFKKLEEDITQKIENLKSLYNGRVFVSSEFNVIQRLRDMNSVAPCINTLGRLLSSLRAGEHPGITSRETGKSMQVPNNIAEFQEQVRNLVIKL